MYEKLLKTVTNLGSPRVLVAGDFMLDVYIYGDALRISPEAPVPVLKITDTQYSCGGAGSVAADLAALGAVPHCLGIVGKDLNGQILRKMLTDTRADISALFSLDNRPTTSKQRLIGLAQHRHRQQLMRMDQESVQPLAPEEYEKILQAYKEKLPHVDIVCLQDYDKYLLPPWLCEQIIKLAAQADKKIIVDPCLESDYSKYRGATVITPNRREASTAAGVDIKSPDDARMAAEQLAKTLKLKAVVITLDKEGAFLKADSISEMVPTRPRSVYDVTGAGDMVLATLAVTLAAGCDYKTAVQLANITGGIEVEKFGTATVSVDEIIDEIVSRNRVKDSKVYPLEALVDELAWHRRKNQTIVFTNGCFDLLHRGHIEFLKFCKSQGHLTVVAVNSDNSVKTIKGPERPVNEQSDRVAVLAALETVDYITVFDQPTPLEAIEKIKPDVLVKGRDWAKKGVVGADFVKSYGGKVVLAPLVEGKSSSKIIEKTRLLGNDNNG